MPRSGKNVAASSPEVSVSAEVPRNRLSTTSATTVQAYRSASVHPIGVMNCATAKAQNELA